MMLSAEQVTKTYSGGETPLTALRGVDLALAPGEFVAIMGPSGCGKSTLLHLCGAMDRPSSGRVIVEGRDLARLDDDALTRVRRERIGFVFQFFNLLPTLTVEENIGLPLLLAGTGSGDTVARARGLAHPVGPSPRLHPYPPQVSGGGKQPAATPPPLVHGPALLVADEPTGNLDSQNGARVLALLSELNAERGVAILLATHAPEVAAAAHRTLHMRDGQVERVVSQRPVEGPHGAAL